MSIEFSPEKTIIIWNNWHWKSSILEAVYFLSIWKAYRSKTFSDVIKFWEEFTQIKANISNWSLSIPNENCKSLFIWFTSKPKLKIKYKFQSSDISAFDFLWNFNCVLFTPNDLKIITQSPSDRRTFLNSLLIRLDKKYANLLNTYLKVHSQRNALLKDISQNKCDKEYLHIWNNKLIQYWYEIQIKRIDIIKDLLKLIDKFYNKISKSKDKFKIKLISNSFWDLSIDRASYLKQIEKTQEKDIIFWSTSVWPHRDDILFTLNWKDMRQFASQWEIRTWVLALKYAEIEILKEKKWHITLLLDDVFSELDEHRQKSLISLSKKFQTIISCTHPPYWYKWKLLYKISNWIVK